MIGRRAEQERSLRVRKTFSTPFWPRLPLVGNEITGLVDRRQTLLERRGRGGRSLHGAGV